MNQQVIRIVRLCIMFFILLSPAVYAEKINITDVANTIAKEVGAIGASYKAGTKGNVFIFEEYHTSRLGRLQIALMLHRLNEKFNLNKIGLEGAMQSPQPISAQWFHDAGGANAKSVREDAAVRMLSEGEINAAEFMELINPAIEVYGLELPEEYNVTLDAKSEPRIMYLLAIAQKYPFNQAQIKEINRLIKQNQMSDAATYMLNADPWTRQKYAAVKSSASKISLEELLKQIDEITRKAQEVNAQIPPETRQDMEKTKKFFETASQRSTTMVKYVVDKLVDQNSHQPVAIIIGAAHTQEIIDKFKNLNVSCVQITPKDLNPKYGSLSHEQFDLKNKKKWAQTDSGTLGNLLNSHRNPPPIIETATGKSYASMYMASMLIANHIKAGNKIPPIPEDIQKQLNSLPEFKIDYQSITPDGNDVIFRSQLKNTDNKEISVWARVGIVAPGKSKNLTVEDKLQTAISEVRKQAKIEEQAESTQKRQKGGQDGKKASKSESLKLVALNQDAKAKFANSKDLIMAQKKISS